MFPKFIPKKWSIYWQYFTQPAASVQGEKQRQQASLLAALSLSLLLVGVIFVTIWIWANPEFTAAPYISAGAVTLLVLVYALSRTRYHRAGAGLFIVVLILTVGAVYLTAPGSEIERIFAAYFLAVAVLLASILLSMQVTLFVIGISLIAAVSFFFAPGMPFTTAYAFLVFIVVTSALLVVATSMRNRDLQRLRDSEERFRRLTFSSPDTISIYNFTRNQMEFINNPTFLGYTEEEMARSNAILSRVHPDDLNRVAAFWQAVYDGRETAVRSVDYRLQHSAGHWEWVRNRATILSRKPDGTAEQILIIATVITEQKQVEEQIHRSEEQYRQLVDSVGDIIFQTDLAGIWIFLNRAWTDITGFTVQETLGANFLDYVHPEDREANMAECLLLVEKKRDYCRHEVRYLTKEGGTCWLEVHARRAEDENGRILGITGLLRDVTARKQREYEREQAQQLMVANEQLQELDQLKTKFMDDVSHELRTPATTISLYLDLLERGRTDKRENYLATLQANSRRLNELIESILQFSDLTQAAAAYEPTAIRLNDMVANVVKQHRGRAEKAGLDLVFLPEPHLPPVTAVARLLFRALGYLLDNALKYTLGGSVTVSTYLNEGRQMACVQIKDTGIGIEQNELERVFDRFYRGRRVSQLTTPGAGLGLSLAQEIVVRYGGRIEIQSEPGAGTTVYLWLPLFNQT